MDLARGRSQPTEVPGLPGGICRSSRSLACGSPPGPLPRIPNHRWSQDQCKGGGTTGHSCKHGLPPTPGRPKPMVRLFFRRARPRCCAGVQGDGRHYPRSRGRPHRGDAFATDPKCGSAPSAGPPKSHQNGIMQQPRGAPVRESPPSQVGAMEVRIVSPYQSYEGSLGVPPLPEAPPAKGMQRHIADLVQRMVQPPAVSRSWSLHPRMRSRRRFN